MKFCADANIMKAALSAVQGVVLTTTTQPILSHVRMVATTAGKVSITACDTVRQYHVTIDADVASPGEIAVPGHMLRTIVARVPSSASVCCVIENGRMKVMAKAASFLLPTLPGNIMPDIRDDVDGDEFEIPADALCAALGRVKFAASTESSRAYINGVRIEAADGWITMVATCGHRFATSRIKAAGPTPVAAVTVPRATIPEIIKMCESRDPGDMVRVQLGTSMIEVSTAAARLSSRLIAEDYPDWRRVVDTAGANRDPTYVATLPKLDFELAVDRISVITGSGEPIAFESNIDGLHMSGINGDAVAHDTVECVSVGGRVTVGMRASYVAEVLASIPDGAEINFSMISASHPGVFRISDNPDCWFMVMPMAIKTVIPDAAQEAA